MALDATQIYTLSLHDALPISADLMKELLNVFDSFELALKNAAAQAGGQNMLRGFELIFKQIQDTVARFGLKPDRKSTRLNSSHLGISYAVFCLKKKKKLTKNR